MSAQGESRIFPTYQDLVSHLRTPLYRNGYFLMISSLSTSGIGLVYWILAAHRYPTYLVGINSAMIAAMTFLAGVSELNLMSALIRFIPVAGRKTKHFVLLTYLVSLIVSAIISVIFILNIARWAPALNFLDEDPALKVWFILATMSWCIFVLQDSVLTGLRQTSWVPVENTVFSLTKIALMIIFAVSIPALGIFASWTFALIVAILPTNYFIFRHLIPNHAKEEDQTQGSVEPGQIIRFAATDYLGAISWLIATTLMPVIVTSISGATANAYFYLAWTIANTLYLIPPALGSSLVVETAKDQQKLGFYSHRIFINAIKIIIPAAVVIAVGAPYILMIFGKDYSTAGANVLRLLALSAIPNVVNSIFISAARVQRRLRPAVVTLCTLCIFLLGTSIILLHAFGIVGVGIAWLTSQTVVALVVYLYQLRKLWVNQGQLSNPSRVDSYVYSIKSHLISLLYISSKTLNLFPILSFTRQKWSAHNKYNQISTLLPIIVEHLPEELRSSKNERWKLNHVANNLTDTIVAFVDSTNGTGPVVLKIPTCTREAESLRKQRENISNLAGDVELGDWLGTFPRVVAHGSIEGYEYYAETVMPGIPLRKMLGRNNFGWNVVAHAANRINVLHQKTARCISVDAGLVETWVNEPINNIIRSAFNTAIPVEYRIAIDHLQYKLQAAIYDRQVCVSWIHGDYSPENILVDSSGSQVTGIVDWDLARPDELPMLDLMHLFISIRMETMQQEMGKVVSDLLIHRGWNPAELKMIQEYGQELKGSAIDLHDLLLLTWLRHINANLSKTAKFDNHKQWVAENIIAVLLALDYGEHHD